MTKRILAVFLMFAAGVSLIEASVLNVDRINFEKAGRDEWIRCRVRLSSTGNPDSAAKNRRFLDNVSVDLYLSHGDSRNGFTFNKSSVKIITLEQGERYAVDFFIPGAVVKRDRMSLQPFAYYLKFKVGDYDVPFESNHASTNMRNEVARKTFENKTDENAALNQGMLIPSYLAPTYLWLENEEDYPAFVRTEATVTNG